jgi:hypothetical protein
MSENGHRMSDSSHNPGPDFGASRDRMRASELQLDLAAFETRLRETYVRPPTAAVAEAHVQAMLAEADAIAATAVVEAPPTRTRAPRSRWVALRRLALVPLAVLVAGGGLALAGVRPPEPISDVFESVGIDVPGTDEEAADEEAADDGREGKSPGDSAARDRSDGEAPAASSQGGSNAANDGPTPGAEHANRNAGEGQETAEQARSGQTPPDMPGRSEDHPAPQGNGTPPEDPGHPGHGKPDSPPGQSHSSALEQGGGTANKPVKPDKVKSDK